MKTSIVILVVLAGYSAAQNPRCPNQCFASKDAVDFFCAFQPAENECSVKACTSPNSGWKCAFSPTSCPNKCSFDRNSAEQECKLYPEELNCAAQKCGKDENDFKCAPAPDTAYAKCIGDPHCTTFDKRYMNCQGNGEFLLSKSTADPYYELQGRFTRGNTGSLWSVSTAVALRYETLETIQVERKLISGSCKTEIRYGGQLLNLPDGEFRARTVGSVGSSSVSVARNLQYIHLRATNNGNRRNMFVVLQEGTFVGMCMLWEVRPMLLGTILVSTQGITGLLGNPNGDILDDMKTPQGAIVPFNGNRDQTSYCNDNWCIRNENDSIFSYHSGDTFNTFMDCDGVNMLPVSRQAVAIDPEVRRICQGDVDCEFDGRIGGAREAQMFKNVVTLSQIDTNAIKKSFKIPLNLSIPSLPPLPSARPTPSPSPSKTLPPKCNCNLARIEPKCLCVCFGFACA